MGDLPRQIHIGEFRIGCIFVKVYIYILYLGKVGFRRNFECGLDLEIDFFLFFFRKIVSKNFELKVLENCEFEREYFFWIFITLPSIFQGKNVSWNFRIEVCRTVLNVIPRIARD